MPHDEFNFCPDKSYTLFMKFRGEDKPLSKWLKKNLQKRGISFTQGVHKTDGGLVQSYIFTPKMVENHNIIQIFMIFYP